MADGSDAGVDANPYREIAALARGPALLSVWPAYVMIFCNGTLTTM
jgi:hypothetical protein